MKLVKNFIIAVILFVLLLLVFATPWALIGVNVFVVGIFLRWQYKKGRSPFSKYGWVMFGGILLTLIFATSMTDTKELATVENDTKEIESKKAEEEKKAAEEKAEEEQRKAEEQKLAEEKAKKEAEQKEQEAAQLQKQELAEKLGLELVTMGRVVDGDTVETSDGRKIRLIGINTPESTTKIEEYGKDASNYTASKLTNKEVWLQKDVSETDPYGRLLRIVWMDIPTNDLDEEEIRSKMFNADLVLNGYAEPSTYNPDVKYSEIFMKFGREAREGEKGLWAIAEEGTTKGDLDKEEVVSSDQSSESGTSVNSTTTSEPADSTGLEEYYQNCTELRKVYPNGVPSTHPAYDSKHDRDKDDYACER